MFDHLYVQQKQFPMGNTVAWKRQHLEVHLFIYINVENC